MQQTTVHIFFLYNFIVQYPPLVNMMKTNSLPPGFKANAAFFKAAKPVKRAKVPGRANDDVENIMGMTPELFTCLTTVRHRRAWLQIPTDMYLNGQYLWFSRNWCRIWAWNLLHTNIVSTSICISGAGWYALLFHIFSSKWNKVGRVNKPILILNQG